MKSRFLTAREAAGLSVDEVAERAQVFYQLVRRCDRNYVPGYASMRKALADALGTTPEALWPSLDDDEA